MTREFTRRGFLAWVSTGRPPDELKNEDHFSLKNSNLRLNLPTIIRDNKNKEQVQDDNDEVWLAGTGLVKYNPENGQNMPKRDIISNRVPVENTENIQLPDAHALKRIVRPTIDLIYPSLSYYLGEDIKTEQELHADSSAKLMTGGGAQVFRKPVKIIYAMAPLDNFNDGTVGLTRMQVAGNEVEYAIIIRLNPAGVQFKSKEEFNRWIQSVYVHEMIHVKQKDILWEKLISESLIKSQPPSPSIIFSTLDNPANIINNEALAYWAGMSYAQMIQPSWFTSDASPNFTGLKKPFLKLKTMGMDPLIRGEKITPPEYDENTLENLWLYSVFFNVFYKSLVASSTPNGEQVQMIEKCYQLDLISNSEFMEYLRVVDPIKYNQYKVASDIKANVDNSLRFTGSLISSEAGLVALGATGITALLLAIRMRGK